MGFHLENPENFLDFSAWVGFGTLWGVLTNPSVGFTVDERFRSSEPTDSLSVNEEL
jgi:hypothetical protein